MKYFLLCLSLIFLFSGTLTPAGHAEPSLTAAVDSWQLSGTVKDADGKPIRNARVLLSHGLNEPLATTVTGSLGIYVFSGLEGGVYRIDVKADRYEFTNGAAVVLDVFKDTSFDFVALAQ